MGSMISNKQESLGDGVGMFPDGTTDCLTNPGGPRFTGYHRIQIGKIWAKSFVKG